MEKHIDVMGYLLGALVFSIGFLSAREHSQYEAVAAQVRDRSWHLRELLNRGGRVTPEDLAAELDVLRPNRDRVALLSRGVNLTLFAATAIVYVDAVRLIGSLEELPASALLITTCVFGSACAVIAIGEYDSRRVGIDEHTVVERSVLGDLDRLRGSLAAGDFPQVRSVLSALQEQHPGWHLLDELRSLVDVKERRWDAAWERVSAEGSVRSDVQLTPVIVTTAALATDRTAEGHALLARLSAEVPSRSGLVLERSLAMLLLHADAVFCELTTHVAADLDRHVRERGTSALDVRPADLDATRDLLQLMHAWHAPGALDDLPQGAVGSWLGVLIREATAGGADDRDGLAALSQLGAPALETLGLVCLAQRRSRQALRLYERAVRSAPASATAHWGRALACHQLAWSDAAVESLRRAASLGLGDALHGCTSAMLMGATAAENEDELMSEGAITDLDKFRLGLTGVDVRVKHADASPREELISRLLASASVPLQAVRPEVTAPVPAR